MGWVKMDLQRNRKSPRSREKRMSDAEGPSLPSARDRITDYIALRDHSEAELRTKLARYYDESEIDDAIDFARKQNWIVPEADLAKRVANALSQKNKGYEYISNYLHSKGLPPVSRDHDEELRKARALIDSKLAKGTALDYEGKKKLHRLLAGRGFESEVIRDALSLTDEDGSF